MTFRDITQLISLLSPVVKALLRVTGQSDGDNAKVTRSLEHSGNFFESLTLRISLSLSLYKKVYLVYLT